MNSKERVYAALRHENPDRVPRFVWLGSEVVRSLSQKTGLSPIDLNLSFGNDVLQTWVSINGEMERDVPQGTVFVDEWGITWKRDGYYNMVVNHPLKDKNSQYILDYKLPDPHSMQRFERLEYLIENYGDRYFIGGDVSGVLFEPAYHLRGMEDLLVDMMEESECV
ncbi:MAG TPA: methyltransferase, partial [Clostridia bacterium]|nr:methyltransferase [Clostridia bacterium]